MARSQFLAAGGFRGLLVWGIAATVCVLVVNVVLLIVSATLPSSPNTGGKLLFSGDCDAVSTRSTVAHLGINVLATLVLAASNAAMQCLSAPTREDVDRAHPRGITLDIGVSSLRNLFHSDRFRCAAWIALFITSLPLHLVYNSIFLQTTQANAYNTLIVTQDFLHGAWSQIPGAVVEGEAMNGVPIPAMQKIQAEVHTYTRLSLEECKSAYDVPLVSDWANLVAVTNVTTMQQSPSYNAILSSFWYPPSVSNYTDNLFTDAGYLGIFAGYGGVGNVELGADAPYFSCSLWPLQGWHNLSGGVKPGEQPVVEALYCLAQPVTPVCTIEIFQPFLGVVIGANLLKILCFVWIIYSLPSLTPLVTFGDAVASFLGRPDPFTAGGRPVSRDWVEEHDKQIRDTAKSLGTLYQAKESSRDRWVLPSIPWIRAPSRSQRWAVSVGSLSLIAFSAVFIQFSSQPPTANFGETAAAPKLSDIWNNGFGNVYPEQVIVATMSWTVGGTLLAANAPQLIISFLYVFYNQYFTLMTVAAEAQAFCVKRQYLRVSRPRGQQRSSFWLGLPLYYAIPLLVACAILHWAISQALFVAEINIVSPPGQIDLTPDISTIGYSIVGSILVLGIGGIMVLVLLGIGLTRVYPTYMPLLSSNSIAIAAACHGHYRSDGEEKGPEFLEAEADAPLKYGVTQVTGEMRGRVGFSSGEVRQMEPQWVYGRGGDAVTSTSVEPKAAKGDVGQSVPRNQISPAEV